LLCGLAWNLPTLIAFRALQAVPGGIIPVVSMALLYRLVPAERVGTAMGLFGLGVILAPALGPVVGGWLVEYASWHLVFFVMVPVGVVGVVAGLLIFPRDTPTSWPTFDLCGFVTIAAGLVSLMLAADRGSEWGWTGYRVLILTTVGLLSLTLFVVVELEVEHPLIDVRVLRSGVFTNSLVLIAISSLGLFALLYYVPLFLQTNQGYQALDAGLLLMPSALTMAAVAPFAGRIFDRLGGRWPVTIGLAIAAYGSALLAGITPDVPRGQLVLWTTIRNFGVGLSMMPIMAAGISALPPALVNAGSTLSNVTLRVASSLGVAGFGGLLTTQHAQLMADRGALLGTHPAGLPAGHLGDRSGLLPLYLQLTQKVTTTTYANAFYLVFLLTAGGAVLALLLRSRARLRKPATGSPGRTPPARGTVAVRAARPPVQRVHAARGG
jgi:EmrB/QacA subfamily drug resistance transporter